MVISRRAFLSVPVLAVARGAVACGPQRGVRFRGYAFVANQEGEAVAAVDLAAMAVARHIPLGGAPTEVLAAGSKPRIYALTPATGFVHEIQSDRLSFTRKIAVASRAISMRLARDERALYVLTGEPRSIVCVALDRFQVEWRMPLPEDATDFALAPEGKLAALSLGSTVRFADLEGRHLGDPIGSGEFGALRFLQDGKTLVAADRGERRLSLYDVASSRLITHLPLAVRPDNLCFKKTDDGQLFITGEGMDAVVIVYPYHTPEVGQTVLAGHAPGAMAASDSFLFVASPQSGDVTILNIGSQKVIGVVSVGSDPGFIAVTPDDQFALVLNRKSGDVAVLRVGTPSRYKERSGALLTTIPVGSRPVSAAVRGV